MRESIQEFYSLKAHWDDPQKRRDLAKVMLQNDNYLCKEFELGILTSDLKLSPDRSPAGKYEHPALAKVIYLFAMRDDFGPILVSHPAFADLSLTVFAFAITLVSYGTKRCIQSR